MALTKERRNKSWVEKYAVSILAPLTVFLIGGLIKTYVDVKQQQVFINQIEKQIEEIKVNNRDIHKSMWRTFNEIRPRN